MENKDQESYKVSWRTDDAIEQRIERMIKKMKEGYFRTFNHISNEEVTFKVYAVRTTASKVKDYTVIGQRLNADGKFTQVELPIDECTFHNPFEYPKGPIEVVVLESVTKVKE